MYLLRRRSKLVFRGVVDPPHSHWRQSYDDYHMPLAAHIRFQDAPSNNTNVRSWRDRYLIFDNFELTGLCCQTSKATEGSNSANIFLAYFGSRHWRQWHGLHDIICTSMAGRLPASIGGHCQFGNTRCTMIGGGYNGLQNPSTISL